jgi:type 1 glutamine amidotransferase
MDLVRLRLLGLLAENPSLRATVAGDYTDLDRWLPGSRLLVTYVAGPILDESGNARLVEWLEAGGRWLALHGTSGGKAVPVDGDRRRRAMVRSAHHDTLGCFFLNHPPLCRFRVAVTGAHDVTAGVPASFEVEDELYLIEVLDPASTHVLLTTELAQDPSPPGFGFVYERDTSVLADGRTRVLGFTRSVGAGGVTYLALGHCHSATSNSQPFVDRSVASDNKTPLVFRGSWDTPAFQTLLRNGIAWGTAAPAELSALDRRS